MVRAPGAGWNPEARSRLLECMLFAHHRPRLVELPHPDTPGTSIKFKVTKVGPKQIKLLIPGHVTIIAHHGGQLEVITHKEALWIDGVEQWTATWIRCASTWFRDAVCTGLHDAGRLGWRVHRLEVCADLTGLNFTYADIPNFHGVSSKHTFHSRSSSDDSVDTIAFGRRATMHSLSLELHDKTQQVIAAGGDPATSIYAPVWRMHGWDGTAPVRRVEARGNRRALHLHDAETGEVFDLSDPAVLLDQEALSRFWLEATHRRRLVLPTRSRPSRCPLDPRWEAIQAAADIAPDTGRLRKLAPQLRQLSLREHEQRARRRLCLAIADSIAVAEARGLHQRVHALRMLAGPVVDMGALEAEVEARSVGLTDGHLPAQPVAADQHFPGNDQDEDHWETP